MTAAAEYMCRAMQASTETIACPDGFADEGAQVAMYASLCRIIEVAPIENKMRVSG